MSKPKTVLIIGFVWPEPNSSAAGSRMMQLIELFIANKYTVVFSSAAADSAYMFDLSSIGVEKKSIELNNQSFDVFVGDLQPHIVLFDRFMTEEQFGWRVAESCPNAIRILDTEDLHCLRYARQNAFKQGNVFSKEDLLSDFSKRELASIYRSDLSLIISEFEMNLLQEHFKVDVSLLHYLPFMLDAPTSEEISKLPAFEERKNFVSIGNFLHEPNVDAVMFLKEEIWPLIRKELPDAELHVCGAYPPQKIIQLNNTKEGFIVKGRVENASEAVKNSSVCLAPLRFGAGLKGKLIEAMLNGTPSVTTAVGAEAMHGTLPWSGSIANDSASFANAAIALYNNFSAWEEAQKYGFEIIRKRFPKEKLGEQLLKEIDRLSLELNLHRDRNFIGAMLMHHGLQSTKYMSRWIELKNKE